MLDDTRWYVVHTYSGYENKVANDIEKVVENRNMQDRILEVSVPTETVTEVREAGAKEVVRKLYPGYVLVKVAVYYDEDSKDYKMTDETWYVIRNTRGVTGFVGPDSKPLPLSEAEVAKLGVGSRSVQVGYAVGDYVELLDSAFAGTYGYVSKIDNETGRVTVTVSMMGKDMPVETDIKSVQPAEG